MNDFYDGLLTQPANVGTQGKPDERGTNFLLAMVRGIGPKDEIEAMMAAQMAAVHMTTMTFARPSPMWITSSSRIVRNGHSTSWRGRLRCRWKRSSDIGPGGEQKVTVQHVTVNEGGQAIVGSVFATGRRGGACRKALRSSQPYPRHL